MIIVYQFALLFPSLIVKASNIWAKPLFLGKAMEKIFRQETSVPPSLQETGPVRLWMTDCDETIKLQN